MLLIMRTLYQQCHLVHGDLSEYNILVHEVRRDICTESSTHSLIGQPQPRAEFCCPAVTLSPTSSSLHERSDVQQPVHMLAAQGELYIIDVSQSVDLDHPHALDFLREDILHVNAFFRRAGVATLTMRELFDFVVDPSINDANIEAAMEHLRDLAGRCGPLSVLCDATLKHWMKEIAGSCVP